MVALHRPSPHNLTLALAALARGKPVIPVDPFTRKPHVAYHNEQVNYVSGALPTERDTRQRWARWPNARPTLVMGPLAGLFGVDIDSQAGLDWFVENFGPLDNTYTIKSNKGWHLWYTWPDFRVGNPVIFRNSDGSAAVEIKGAGGLLPLPGTQHKSGTIYRPANKAPISAAPAALLDLLRPHPPRLVKVTPAQVSADHPYIRAIVNRVCDDLAAITTGRYRAIYLASFKLGTLIGAGALERSEAEAALMSAGQANGFTSDPKHGEREAALHIKNGLDDGALCPRDLSFLDKSGSIILFTGSNPRLPVCPAGDGGNPAESSPVGDDLHPLEPIPSLADQLAQWEALPTHTATVDTEATTELSEPFSANLPGDIRGNAYYLGFQAGMIAHELARQGIARGLISEDTGVDMQTLQSLNDTLGAELPARLLYDGLHAKLQGAVVFFTGIEPPNSTTHTESSKVARNSTQRQKSPGRPKAHRRLATVAEIRSRLAPLVKRAVIARYDHKLLPMLDTAELALFLDGDEQDEQAAAELLPFIRVAGQQQDEVEARRQLKKMRAEYHERLNGLDRHDSVDIPFPWHNAAHFRALYRRAIHDRDKITGKDDTEKKSNLQQRCVFGYHSANGVRAMNKRAGLEGTSERQPVWMVYPDDIPKFQAAAQHQSDPKPIVLPFQDDLKTAVDNAIHALGGGCGIVAGGEVDGKREWTQPLLDTNVDDKGHKFADLTHLPTLDQRTEDAYATLEHGGYVLVTVQTISIYRAVGPVEPPKPRQRREKTAVDAPVSKVEMTETTSPDQSTSSPGKRQKRQREKDFALWFFRRAAELRHGVNLSGDGLTKAECIAILKLDPQALATEYAQVGDRLWLTHDCPELVMLLWHRQRQTAERIAV